MRHIRVISRSPTEGSTTTDTAALVVQVLIAILSAVGPLLEAAMPLKAQQDKYAQTGEEIPDWP